MIKKLFRPMPIVTIRRLILAAILCILFWNIIFWIGEAWNKVSGLIWGVVTAAAAIVCRYQAGKVVQINKKYLLWMSIPAVLTLVPFIVRVVKILNDPQPSGWVVLWQIAPLLISLIIPVGLLGLAYAALKQHVPASESASGEPTHTPPAT